MRIRDLRYIWKRASFKMTCAGLIIGCLSLNSAVITLHAAENEEVCLQSEISEEEETNDEQTEMNSADLATATDGEVEDAIFADSGEEVALVTAGTGSYNDSMAYQVLDIVNQERAANGVAPLSMDSELFEAAKIRAAELSVKFDHTRPDGSSCFTVSDKAYGENIAYGYASPADVMNAWMNSAGHRVNILTGGYQSIGIGCYSMNGTLYWTQLFGYDEAVITPTTVYNGVDYSAVYDYDYYIAKYSDVKNTYGANYEAVLKHFVEYGMKEGRQGCATFNVTSYAYAYADLRRAYKNDLQKYYMHYINYGKKEGRTATGVTTIQNCVSTYGGVDYSAVYNGTYYYNKYSDLRKAYGLDDEALLKHFINYGMKEGRQGKSTFDVYSYAYKYADLRRAYKNDLQKYYMHYINYGKKEGRTATGVTTIQNCVSTYGGVDYSAVYNGTYYYNKYSDLRKAYGLDDEALLKHFINYGMKEGRQANASFNVTIYKNRYADLRTAYGNNLKQYYLHYIKYGLKEGRDGQ